MIWNEPASPDDSTADLEARLWDAANNLWANAALKPSEFSPVVLGAVFLRFAAIEKELAPAKGNSSRRKIGPADYHAKGVLYLPDESRFPTLLALLKGSNLGKALKNPRHPHGQEGTN